MLLFLGILLILFWIIGLSIHILGAFIHIALVLGLILAIVHFLRPTASSRL